MLELTVRGSPTTNQYFCVPSHRQNCLKSSHTTSSFCIHNQTGESLSSSLSAPSAIDSRVCFSPYDFAAVTATHRISTFATSTGNRRSISSLSVKSPYALSREEKRLSSEDEIDEPFHDFGFYEWGFKDTQVLREKRSNKNVRRPVPSSRTVTFRGAGVLKLCLPRTSVMIDRQDRGKPGGMSQENPEKCKSIEDLMLTSIYKAQLCRQSRKSTTWRSHSFRSIAPKGQSTAIHTELAGCALALQPIGSDPRTPRSRSKTECAVLKMPPEAGIGKAEPGAPISDAEGTATRRSSDLPYPKLKSGIWNRERLWSRFKNTVRRRRFPPDPAKAPTQLRLQKCID